MQISRLTFRESGSFLFRRQKGGYALQIISEQSREQIEGKGKDNNDKKQAHDSYALHLAVVCKPDLSEKIKAQQKKQDDPDDEVHLPRKDIQVVSLVDLAEEIKGKGKHNKGKKYLKTGSAFSQTIRRLRVAIRQQPGWR